MAKEKKSKSKKHDMIEEVIIVGTQPKNPDCEPATKGFVKCIARTLYKSCGYHVELSIDGFAGIYTLLAGFVGGVLWLVMSMNHIDSGFTNTVGIAAVVMIIVGLDINSGASAIKIINVEPTDIPEHIKKYSPQECKEDE